MSDPGRTTDPLEETSTWPAVGPPPAELVGSPADQPPPSEQATPPPPATGWAPPPRMGGSTWTPPGSPGRSGDDNGGRIFGTILIIVGVWLLLRRYLDLDAELVLPLVAIGVGGLLLATGLRSRGRHG